VNWSSWAVAGVNEQGFREGWGATVPSYPSYRVLNAGGGVCRLQRPDHGASVVQVRLFFHVERPPVPVIRGRVGRHSWTWAPEPGWHTLQHALPRGRGAAVLQFAVDAEDEPWFEVRVIEVRLLAPDDPRVRSGAETP
jgi:hypothetical protein